MKKLFLLSVLFLSSAPLTQAFAQTDLYIQSISYQYEQSSGYVYVNICNRGEIQNKIPRAHIRIMRVDVWNVTEIQNIGNLKKDQCYNMKVNYNLPEHQKHQIAVLLDPQSQLMDSDRSNNYFIVDFATQGRSGLNILGALTATEFIHEFDKYQHRNTPYSGENQREGDEGMVDSVVVVSVFPDTSANTLEGKAAAELKEKKIINGYPDGEFKGSRSVNRAEIAKFILLAKGIEVPSTIQNKGQFTDVVDGAWYVPYIIVAQGKGILSGYPDGSFRPAQRVNTVEFLKIISKTFNLPENLGFNYSDIPKGAWYLPYVGVAEAYDLFPERGIQLFPGQELTRKEVAIAIYKILEAQ